MNTASSTHKQLPKDIFNLISDRITHLNSFNDYIQAIQICSGKITSTVLEVLLHQAKSDAKEISLLEAELNRKGYPFEQLADLTEMVIEIERRELTVP